MVIAEAMAGVAAGVKGLFDYNRSNYMYDRKMRQETELKILEYRNLQSGLWREDVKDLVSLTERKMDSYLIVNTLQLSMCVMLFAEGRLEPGTPPWLLHLYMLTLGGAFMYLLMSVWLAMHASIVAQVSAVRLLTQFVRLPVPKCEQLQAMRTYGVTYEKLDVKKVMRVPFVTKPPEPDAGDDDDDACSEADSYVGPLPQFRRQSSSQPLLRRFSCESGSSRAGTARSAASVSTQRSSDPWGLEINGRAPYELQHRPVRSLRHVNLVRHEAVNYQSHDAFARVSMLFGTNQLLYAICYYTMGYVTVMDDAPWAALSVAVMMVAISMALIELDLSFSREEHLTAQLLIALGPTLSSIAGFVWDRNIRHGEKIALFMLPFAFFAHGFWLLWGLGACQAEAQPNGAIIPMKFTAVLNLDVFGWLNRGNAAGEFSNEEGGDRGYQLVQTESSDLESLLEEGGPDNPPRRLSSKDLREEVALWESEEAQKHMGEEEKRRVARVAQKIGEVIEEEYGHLAGDGASSSSTAVISSASSVPPPPPRWLKLKNQSAGGVDSLLDAETGEVRSASQAATTDACEVRTLTDLEDSLESLRDEVHARAVRSSPSGSSNPSGPPSRRQGRAMTLPSAIPNMMTVCEEPRSAGINAEEINLEVENNKYLQELISEEHLGQSHFSRPDDFSSELGRGADELDSQAELSDGDVMVPESSQSAQACHARQIAKTNQGRMPWRLFRAATLVLVSLWGCAAMLTMLIASGVLSMPARHWKAPGSDAEAPVSLVSTGSHRWSDKLEPLPDGHLLKADWPRQTSFSLKSMSCDGSGRQLVVADDFGVYSARVPSDATAEGDGAPPARSTQSRRLRQIQSPSLLERASFTRVRPCPALEGQALKDVSVACTEQGEHADPDCRIWVLHDHGQKVTQCPFEPQRPAADARSHADAAAREAWLNRTMKISHDWLQPQEAVDLISVSPECTDLASSSQVSDAKPESDGCLIMVATSAGRLVQLRRHVQNEDELVPDWSLRSSSKTDAVRSVHVMMGGVLVLWANTNTVEALSGQTGESIAKWQLSRDSEWLALAGGREHVYVLGQKTDSARSLWRFPVPQDFIDWANAADARTEM